MQNLSADAILLDSRALQEADQIVTLLTAEWGKKRGVAQGARRKFSRFAGQLQTLSKVRATWFEKEGRELVRISSLETLRPAHQLHRDLEGTLLAAYLADHMTHFAQENDESARLYRLLDSTTEALISGVDRWLAARYFEAWVLRLGGFFPTPVRCPRCDSEYAGEAALTADAEIVCLTCEPNPRRLVSSAALKFLRAISTKNLLQMNQQRVPQKVLGEIETLCATVRRGFLQHELRSYEVMKQSLGWLEESVASSVGVKV